MEEQDIAVVSNVGGSEMPIESIAVTDYRWKKLSKELRDDIKLILGKGYAIGRNVRDLAEDLRACDYPVVASNLAYEIWMQLCPSTARRLRNGSL